jgi:hypothetical protein
MFFFPPFRRSKSKEQIEEEEREKVADEFVERLEKMTPAERRKFWEDHDRDTSSKT